MSPVYGWEDFISSGARNRNRLISMPALNPLNYHCFCLFLNVVHEFALIRARGNAHRRRKRGEGPGGAQ